MPRLEQVKRELSENGGSASKIMSRRSCTDHPQERLVLHNETLS